MISDLAGLAAYTQWQDPTIPGPSYKFYEFWFKTVSMNVSLCRKVKIQIDAKPEEELEYWIECMYPNYGLDVYPVAKGYKEL